MRKLYRAALGLTLAVGACSPDDQISVPNNNTPDAIRALARPADVENLIAGSFATWYGAAFGANDNVDNQMKSMAMENGSALANFAMGPRSAIPRSAVTNSRQNAVSAGNLREFNSFSRAASAAALGLSRIGPAAGQLTLGSTAFDNRARAFGYFVMGLAHGHLAITYDSAAFITVATSGGQVPPLVGADSMFRVAMAQLDSAQAIASDPATASAFPLPGTWIPNNALSVANFVRVIRSYKAKIRAAMARNPTERAAVNWGQVLADAQAGINFDLNINTNTTTIFSPLWASQMNSYGTWHQMPPTMIGMADTSGAYAAWISTTPMANRGSTANPPFVIVTPDLRFPQGTTFNAQVQYSAGGVVNGCALASCSATNQIPGVVPGVTGGRPYFRARPSGENSWDGSWYNSPYDFYRYRNWFAPTGQNRTGPYPLFLKAENFGLIAEAAYRTGNFVLASNFVDSTRVPAGLPAITPLGLTATGTVQGTGSAAACIPKVPTGPQGPVVCGGLLEAIKYEKRLEVAFTSYGAWFLDARGWGDLPAGTSLQWPTPWQELDTRFKSPYNRPTSEVAPTSAYGW